MNRALLLFALMLIALALLVGLRQRTRSSAQAAASRGSNAAEPEPAGLETKPIHKLRNRDLSGADKYLVRNLVPGPIEVRCRAVVAENMRADPALPRTLVLQGREERVVTEWHAVDPTKSSRAGVSCAAMIGDPRAQPAEDVEYALPFRAGTAWTLDQGFDGSFSHHGAESRHALDFGVPEGTPVLAAREGLVIEVEEDFRATGTDVARFADRANYVRVLHADGSMALYAHLAPRNLLSRPGDRVRVGQLIGKSGNTGMSTGPHLHFSVQRNAGLALETIPFRMAGVDPRRNR